MDKHELEALVRQFLQEKLQPTVLRAEPITRFSAEDLLPTGNPQDKVYTHDLFTLEQSPRLGAGWMEITKADFAWHLDYDEMDYIAEGELEIVTEHGTVKGKVGDVLFIPKGSDIRFRAESYARFLYFTYPADWQTAK